jgi:hypothetical protein
MVLLMLMLQNSFAESEWFFPTMELFHIIGFAFSIGTIAVVDFSLLGVGIPRERTARVYKSMAPFTMIGIANMLITGGGLLIGNPGQYNGPAFFGNVALNFKIWMLLAAIIFNYTIHRKVALSNPSPAFAGTVALVSLAMWGSLIYGGIFIAFAA